ncbi:MAG TPA: sigma-70 family RNA polymerase sigma factor [Hanamia sp.]|nr:sigma-70 family RNA polymerase sigma factor [Hanamia sp.]
MKEPELIPHLFRTEYSRITAVLSKFFGLEHVEIAEDIASETFLAAVETWPYKGIPANPTAWLYTVAKNKAKNYFNRHKIFSDKIVVQLKAETPFGDAIEIDLSEKNITDSQLQMLFAVCHPAISTESQISLALRILCGFGIDEIADAFLTNKETINKRIFRAKEKLRNEKVEIVFPTNEEIENRLENVLRTIYLLFSEGYYSEREDSVIRKELCLEAMKLNYLLLQNEPTNTHSTNALMALMCFHTSRLDARQNENGELILYEEQDESLWNEELIEKGNYHLQKAAEWKVSSKYYLEANIAYWHTIKEDTKEKWENILQLYNYLLQIEYSPIAALNRTLSLSKARGKREAIVEAEKLNLTNNHFYYVLLAELYKDIHDEKVKPNLEKALTLSKTEAERKAIQKKIDSL